MRTHGWGGHPPADDDEAVRRIHDATRACIDRLGAATGISDVARELGVTRQTVYRYFRSSDDLLAATALSAAAPFLGRVRRHLEGITDPGDAVVEGVAFTLEQLPNEPYVGLLVQPDQVRTHGHDVTSQPARSLARSFVDGFGVDWAAHGLRADDLDELAEHLLRLIQSFVIDPGDPPRSGEDLRRYLRRWVAPAVRPARGSASRTRS